jgi:DNA-binding CsgD family transcriptional regulator
VIHRKILDVAESRPDASLEAIADDVSGASVDLVDRVLTEYGDPHRDDSGDSGAVEVDASSSAATGNSDGDGESLQSVPDLTEKERITLRAVAEDPDAPQSAIAEKLGVTRATVSRRLNSIEGFEWRTRREFAERVFGPSTDHEEQSDQGTAAPERVAADGYRDDVAASGGDAPADENAGTDESSEADESAEADERSTDDGANETETREASPMDADVSDDGETPGAADDPSVDAQIETLRSSISGLERRVAELDGPEQSSEVDPELVQKVIHACMNADSISEDEELIVLKRLM